MIMFRPMFYMAIALGVSACAQDSASGKDYGLLEREGVSCDPPAIMEIQQWGESGLSASCNIRSGPFVVAEDGYVHLRGHYKGGLRVGIWRWYGPQGNLLKEIDYSSR